MRPFVFALSFVLFTATASAASEVPTKSDAKALVKQAVTFARSNGKENFLNEVRSPKGMFHFQEQTKKGLYIFVYDEKGTVLAHGVRLELTGKNRWNDKDPDGKYWIRDWTTLVHKSGSGWLSYKEYNPSDRNKIMDKSSYVELVDGMVIGCGIYAP